MFDYWRDDVDPGEGLGPGREPQTEPDTTLRVKVAMEGTAIGEPRCLWVFFFPRSQSKALE